jgi:hypothetical protein
VDAVPNGASVLQPRAEVTRELGGSVRLHGSVGRTAQWVSALNVDRVVPQAPIWWAQGDSLSATISDNVAIGAAGAPTAWARMRGEFYARRTTGLVRSAEEGNGVADLVQESGWSAGLGLDLVLWDGHAATLKWNHTFGRASIGRPRRPAPWDIRHSGDIRLDWRPGAVELAVSLGYATGRPLPVPIGTFSGLEIGYPYGLQYSGLYTVYSRRTYRLPSYFRVDVGVARRFAMGPAEFEVSVKVLNATRHLNTLYYRLGSTPGSASSSAADAGQRLWPRQQLPLMIALGLNGTLR